MSKRKGFTIIEVIMFMAISAALFIGVAVGMQNSIFQQRYNDTTQSFLEFLRSVYADVLNPQSTGAGNSDIALYGKLIVFGENRDITGDNISGSGGDRPIFTYDVVGDADINVGAGSITNTLAGLNANVVKIERGTTGKITKVELMGPEKYTPHFGAYIETTEQDSNGNNTLYEGSILIARHPGSGTVNTLKLNVPIQVNDEVRSATATIASGGNPTSIETLLTKYLNGSAAEQFEVGEIDFCINPYAETMPSNAVSKRNIRIMENARNASGIELIDLDSSENRCI